MNFFSAYMYVPVKQYLKKNLVPGAGVNLENDSAKI